MLDNNKMADVCGLHRQVLRQGKQLISISHWHKHNLLYFRLDTAQLKLVNVVWKNPLGGPWYTVLKYRDVLYVEVWRGTNWLGIRGERRKST